MFNHRNRYRMSCRTVCSYVPCKCTSEVVLWESDTERKWFCTDCGSTRIEKLYKPCTYYSFLEPVKEVKRDKYYLVIL